MNLEQRLARLERGNRRMKRIGALVLVVAAAVVLSGAAMRKYRHLEVGSLTLKDKAGNTRVYIGTDEDGSVSLSLKDKAGKTRALLDVARNGSALWLSDKDGEDRVMLSTITGWPQLVFFDKAGNTRLSLNLLDDGASLHIHDKDRLRATLGVSRGVDKRTGAKTKTTAGTLTLFDAKGDVIWQAPR